MRPTQNNGRRVKQMRLSEEELERLHERFPYPRFSQAEYQRRYENIRKMMREMEENKPCA
jgi:hypothetical protein